MKRYRVVFTKKADQLLITRAAWWVENRDATHVFEEELDQTIERLKNAPKLIGPRVANSDYEIRRALMPKTRTHLYYRVHEDKALVEIVCVWGTVRGDGPDLSRYIP